MGTCMNYVNFLVPGVGGNLFQFYFDRFFGVCMGMGLWGRLFYFFFAFLSLYFLFGYFLAIIGRSFRNRAWFSGKASGSLERAFDGNGTHSTVTGWDLGI